MQTQHIFRYSFCKTVAVLLIWATPILAKAQTDSVYTRNPLNQSVKVIVFLNNNNIINGTVANINDSSITLEVKQAIKNADNADSTINLNSNKFYTLRTEDIKAIKIKRKAFLTGLVAGGLVGGMLAYGTGYITHSYDNALTSDANNLDAKTRGGAWAIVGAAVVGVAGSIIAPVIMRKKFKVNGRRENMHEVVIIIEQSL